MRRLPNGLALELGRGGKPALVLVQGNRRVVVALTHVKAVVAGLTDAADLAGLLASWWCCATCNGPVMQSLCTSVLRQTQPGVIR